MAAAAPQSTPWVIGPRGRRDGVSEKHKKTNAPASPPKQRRRRKMKCTERRHRWRDTLASVVVSVDTPGH
jgi:hypothetical protein